MSLESFIREAAQNGTVATFEVKAMPTSEGVILDFAHVSGVHSQAFKFVGDEVVKVL